MCDAPCAAAVNCFSTESSSISALSVAATCIGASSSVHFLQRGIVVGSHFCSGANGCTSMVCDSSASLPCLFSCCFCAVAVSPCFSCVLSGDLGWSSWKATPGHTCLRELGSSRRMRQYIELRGGARLYSTVYAGRTRDNVFLRRSAYVCGYIPPEAATTVASKSPGIHETRCWQFAIPASLRRICQDHADFILEHHRNPPSATALRHVACQPPHPPRVTTCEVLPDLRCLQEWSPSRFSAMFDGRSN